MDFLLQCINACDHRSAFPEVCHAHVRICQYYSSEQVKTVFLKEKTLVLLPKRCHRLNSTALASRAWIVICSMSVAKFVCALIARPPHIGTTAIDELEVSLTGEPFHRAVVPNHRVLASVRGAS